MCEKKRNNIKKWRPYSKVCGGGTGRRVECVNGDTTPIHVLSVKKKPAGAGDGGYVNVEVQFMNLYIKFVSLYKTLCTKNSDFNDLETFKLSKIQIMLKSLNWKIKLTKI